MALDNRNKGQRQAVTISPLELWWVFVPFSGGTLASGATSQPSSGGTSLTRRDVLPVTHIPKCYIIWQRCWQVDQLASQTTAPRLRSAAMALPRRFAGALAQLVARPTAAGPRLGACPACRQRLSTTRPREAGHNKWSKTKHIKAVTDKKKMLERTAFTKLITMYSRSMQISMRAWLGSVD